MKRAITKEEFFALKDVDVEEVKIPGLDFPIFIKTLTGEGRDEYERMIVDDEGKSDMTNYRAKLVSLCAVDDKGDLLFTKDDISILGKKSHKLVNRLYEVAVRLSGLRKEDREQAVKN